MHVDLFPVNVYVLDSNSGIASSNLYSNKYNRILILTIIKLIQKGTFISTGTRGSIFESTSDEKSAKGTQFQREQ
jgi:hypothetical protein